ncbi:MAG TPA: phosphatidate cytidylyltransferase, partial [Firmicutes bacterium]|nr:phosphatidate cytidylyltransferase [Bacillota bacterium]
TLIFGGIWELVYTRIGIPAEISYLNLTLVAVLGSLISMFGDLSASVIKRHCQIKDFGNLIPGHGGIMDRFDSVIFVAPFLYLISQVLPVIAA